MRAENEPDFIEMVSMVRLLSTRKAHVMDENDYSGLVETWKIELLWQRAKRLGFREDELPDLQQEIIFDILSFQFDPAKSNGATETTALTAVIDRRLKTMLRTKCRYQSRIERMQNGQQGQLESRQADQDQLALDVHDVIACLPEREQFICKRLLEGHCLYHIAEELRCSWPTLKRLLVGIRRSFREQGLDGWLVK
jgi:RNA polymerase sigma factor (sigma-70 family)